MKKETKNILIVTSVLLSVGALAYYYLFKKEKSFLDYTEDEKLLFFEEQKKIRNNIKKNPNLSPSQKTKQQEALNKENLEKFTKEEQYEMAKFNIDRLMNGDFQGQIQFFDTSAFKNIKLDV